MSVDTTRPSALTNSVAFTVEELTAIRLLLEEQSRQLLRELDKAGIEFTTSVTDNAARTDLIDIGAHHSEVWQEVCVAKNMQEALDQTELALTRLANGQYGGCQKCELPIAKERLSAFPRAVLCIPCKSLN